MLSTIVRVIGASTRIEQARALAGVAIGLSAWVAIQSRNIGVDHHVTWITFPAALATAVGACIILVGQWDEDHRDVHRAAAVVFALAWLAPLVLGVVTLAVAP